MYLQPPPKEEASVRPRGGGQEQGQNPTAISLGPQSSRKRGGCSETRSGVLGWVAPGRGGAPSASRGLSGSRS